MATLGLPFLYFEKRTETESCKVCKKVGGQASRLLIMLEEMYYAGRSRYQICQLRVLGIPQAMRWNPAPPIVHIEMDTYSGTIVIHVINEKYRNDLWLQSVAYGLNLFSIELFTPFRTKACFYPFVGVRRDIARTGQDAALARHYRVASALQG
jgi:hypothetical protein